VAPLLWVAAGGVAAAFLTLHGNDFIRAFHRAFAASWSLVIVGAVFEVASIAGYVLLMHRVIARGARGLRLKDSYDITLAGNAAARLLPTAGLGGAAVTVWALRARGMRTSEIAERLLAFLLLLYGVYVGALLAAGAAVGLGLVPVQGGRALGLLGAALAVALAATVLVLFAAPERIGILLRRARSGSGRLASAAAVADEKLPVLRASLQRSWTELRRPHPALLGALVWWGFDIAVLGAMLHAFGVTMQIPAVVLAYFLGTLFNVLPFPGSLSGGLVGVLIALGAPGGAAIAAVLAYRAIAVWLPAVSGIPSVASLRASVARWRVEAAPEPAPSG
jgi:uncharacterized membrane protein YbhN (UPF0104 family)